MRLVALTPGRMKQLREILTSLLVFTVSCAASGQVHTFRLEKGELDASGNEVPLIEGWVRFDKSARENLSNIPPNLEVEYTSIQLSTSQDSLITGLRGVDRNGDIIYYFDQANDEDFSNDSPIAFHKEGETNAARFKISYDDDFQGKTVKRHTVLSLYERKPGKLEYHLNELWKTNLSFGGERLPIVIQRFPPNHAFVFLDINYSRKYDKPFSVTKEILGLGGRFFELNVAFSNETVTLIETNKQPVDERYPAPKFREKLWGSNDTFSIPNENEKITLLTFWSPYCSGSREEVKSYNDLKSEFQDQLSIDFVAVISDSTALREFLENNVHSFSHIANRELWDLYGVTAPFATFIINKQGLIVKRFFGFSEKISEELVKL